MIKGFETLTPEEFEKLRSAIVHITVLVAGADGEIDSQEKEWAEKVTSIRAYKYVDDLIPYYKEVGKDFTDKLDALIERFTTKKSERTAYITQQLTDLNPILAKLDSVLAHNLYVSFKTFAKHVAKASGGFMGFLSIDKDEDDRLSLSMIHPVDV